MTGKFEDHVVLVAGAATGIGEAAAKAFAKEGAKLAITVHNTPAPWADELASQGVDIIQVPFDATDMGSIANLISGVAEHYGRIDTAINNWGVLPKTIPLIDTPEEEFDLTILVDLKAVYVAMQWEVRQMLKNNGGSIINVASVAGVIADPCMGPYVAAKHGVAGLSKSVAIEYAKQGIRVNAVAPGLVSTPMTAGWLADPMFRRLVHSWNALSRTGRPEEIAGIFLYLADPANSFTTGQVFVIDAAQTSGARGSELEPQ